MQPIPTWSGQSETEKPQSPVVNWSQIGIKEETFVKKVKGLAEFERLPHWRCMVIPCGPCFFTFCLDWLLKDTSRRGFMLVHLDSASQHIEVLQVSSYLQLQWLVLSKTAIAAIYCPQLLNVTLYSNIYAAFLKQLLHMFFEKAFVTTL